MEIFNLTNYSNSDNYIFTNPNSGKVLDIPENSKFNSVLIKINTENNSCSQKRQIIDDKKGNYEILSKCSSKALDVDRANPNPGTKPQIYERNGTIAQKWQFQKVNN